MCSCVLLSLPVSLCIRVSAFPVFGMYVLVSDGLCLCDSALVHPFWCSFVRVLYVHLGVYV